MWRYVFWNINYKDTTSSVLCNKCQYLLTYLIKSHVLWFCERELEVLLWVWKSLKGSYLSRHQFFDHYLSWCCLTVLSLLFFVRLYCCFLIFLRVCHAESRNPSSDPSVLCFAEIYCDLKHINRKYVFDHNICLSSVKIRYSSSFTTFTDYICVCC